MKTKIQNLFIGLALIAGTHQTTAQVTNLSIAPVAGGQSLLYWPVSTTTYVLQTLTNLTSTNWVTARTALAVNTGEVTNSASSGFFRLQPTTTPAGMALIPAGWFTIGNSIGDDDISDATPTNVYVSAFVMDVNLVNYRLWTNVYAYATSHGYSLDHPGLDGYGDTGTNYPVTLVDWYDCVKWCNARSQQGSNTPCYYTDAAMTQVYTNGDTDAVYVNWSANGYRLPTEAEWEKAARGGGIGRRFPWGNLIHTNQAQYGYDHNLSYDLGPANSPSGPSPVGSFDVNGYGLYDMAGNVFEWCWDWYASPPYPAGSPYLGGTNPTGAATGVVRVLRGGVWSYVAALARSAYRFNNYPSDVGDGDVGNGPFGFRCVRGL